MWILTDKEYEAILKLSGPERYAHFIKRVADMEELWSLGAEDGWCLSGDNAGRECVPVWPHARHAAACATGSWAGNEPRSITLNEWLERWLPGIQRDQMLVSVFQVPSGGGVVVPAERLAADLEEELSKYELEE